MCLTTRHWSKLSSAYLEGTCPQKLCLDTKTVVLIFQHCRTGQVNSCNWRMTIAAALPFHVLCTFYIQ